MWIISDYYLWWLAGICLTVCWDQWMKSDWPSTTATVVDIRQHAQKFYEGQEDDEPIPMDEKPVYFFSGKPKPTHVKTTIFLEYEFNIDKKIYRTKKKIEYKKSDYFMGRIFDPEPMKPPKPGEEMTVFYNPSKPADNLIEKPSSYSILFFGLAGFISLFLAIFLQGPF